LDIKDFKREDMVTRYSKYFQLKVARNFTDYRVLRSFATVLSTRILSFYYLYELLNIELNPKTERLVYPREKKGEFDYIEMMSRRKLNL
jgi:hypothetical protein